jgi:hypothetical protein
LTLRYAATPGPAFPQGAKCRYKTTALWKNTEKQYLTGCLSASADFLFVQRPSGEMVTDYLRNNFEDFPKNGKPRAQQEISGITERSLVAVPLEMKEID